MEKETEEKIGRLQLIEQNMQNFLMQKQQLQAQLVEVESALKELKATKSAYKIVGNIMVSSSKEDLEKELKEKKEMLDLRVASIEKQESSLKDKAKKMQQEVLSEMKKQGE
jgi:prefoldin beta subunit